MLSTILGALLPMVVTFLLGFVAAWRHDFGSKDASTLNRMVLVYAVPLALFAGTVTTSRAALSQDVPLVIALSVAIIGLYGLVFLFSRLVFRMRVSTSALFALTASAPAVPFVGPAVLGDLFGGLSAIPIAIASLVINLTVVPVTILLLALNTTGGEPQDKRSGRAGRGALGPVIQLLRFSFHCQTRGDRQRTDRLGARSRFHYRAKRLPRSSTRRPRAFPAGTRIRGRCPVCLRDRPRIRQIQSQQVDLVLRIPQKHGAARPGPSCIAMDRLLQPHSQRGGADDGDSSHADCNHDCSAVSHRTGGGSFRRVPQRDVLDRYDGGFHRFNALTK